MNTVHISNRVRDFDSWKAAFDKFERFRADHGVRACRIGRDVADAQTVTVDLDFDSRREAESFLVELRRIWSTPQSREQLVSHDEPQLLERIADGPVSTASTRG